MGSAVTKPKKEDCGLTPLHKSKALQLLGNEAFGTLNSTKFGELLNQQPRKSKVIQLLGDLNNNEEYAETCSNCSSTSESSKMILGDLVLDDLDECDASSRRIQSAITQIDVLLQLLDFEDEINKT